MQQLKHEWETLKGLFTELTGRQANDHLQEFYAFWQAMEIRENNRQLVDIKAQNIRLEIRIKELTNEVEIIRKIKSGEK